MPFNLLKEYPELLELNFLGGDDRKQQESRIIKQFQTVIRAAQMVTNGES
jgi:hypothetical protein